MMSLEPSIFTLVLFPTISLGKTRSSRIASWTAVKVRLQGNKGSFINDTVTCTSTSQYHYKAKFWFSPCSANLMMAEKWIKHAHLRTRCLSSDVRLGRQHKLITDVLGLLSSPKQKYSGKNAIWTLCTFWASFAFGFWTFLSVWEGFSSTVKTTEIQYYIDSLVKVTWPHG